MIIEVLVVEDSNATWSEVFVNEEFANDYIQEYIRWAAEADKLFTIIAAPWPWDISTIEPAPYLEVRSGE